MKIPLAGGTSVTVSAAGKERLGLAVSASVYWTGADDIVAKTSLDGGITTRLASQPIGGAGFGDGPQGIAVDGTHAYWTVPGSCTGQNSCTGTILRVPLVGGEVETIASVQAYPEFIAVDSTRVYWSNYEIATLMSAPKDGGTPVTLASGAGNPESEVIAVDATSLYWTTAEGGTVMKVPLGGGAATTLASGQMNPAGIAVDDTSVYWTNFTGGTVMKLSPK
jgi:hypothetical protein